MSSTPDRSRDGAYELVATRRDDDSYMHSYTSYSWSVVHVASGEEIVQFGGSWDQDASKDAKSGVESVVFAKSGRAVLATHVDGKRERVELPVSVALSDDQWALVLSYADGRTEARSFRYEPDPEIEMPKGSEAALRRIAAAKRRKLIARLGRGPATKRAQTRRSAARRTREAR